MTTLYTHKYVSLFSGIGGLDEGLHSAGYRPLFCCEIDIHAAESLKNWMKFRNVFPELASDITDIDPCEVRNKLGLDFGELDLLAGGPPCQAFSLIGKRKSLEDERGMLLYQMVRFAQAFGPKVILIEQVKGLKSAPGFSGDRGGALNHLVKKLEELSYKVESQVLKASDFGVPQDRERLFIVASKDHRFRFPNPTHGDGADNVVDIFGANIEPRRTVRDVIESLPAPVKKHEQPNIANHIDITPKRDSERIHGVPEGDYLARQLHLPDHQRMRLNPKKDTTKFRRLAWDKPSLTLRCGEAFYHPIEDRYLTPREYMRIHGFPDELILEGPIRGRTGSVKNLDQHRQVANAVPPLLAKALAEQISIQLLKKENEKSFKAL